MNIKKIVSVASILAIGTVATLALAHGGNRDPQKKFGIFYEPGVFHDGDPATPDQAIVAYTAWDGNNFVVIATFGLDLNLSLAPGSAPNSVILWEYATNADCSGNKKQVSCSGTENVYFVGNPTPLVQDLNWTLTDVDGTNFAFVSEDELPAPGFTVPNGVGSITYQVDGQTCTAALGIMRSLVAANGVNLGNKIHLSDSLCQ